MNKKYANHHNVRHSIYRMHDIMRLLGLIATLVKPKRYYFVMEEKSRKCS